MKYGEIVHGKFKKRLNRFIAEVEVQGKEERVHVKNTGRLKELLLPDANIVLEVSANSNRKTRCSLIGVEKNKRWVNIDSQAPNQTVLEAVQDGLISEIGDVLSVKKEVTYGTSRFDIAFEKEKAKGFIEVKGVTLEREGIALFPDAPTQRGTKHVLELATAAQEGYESIILFLIQLDGCHAFVPNWETDTTLANALCYAKEHGVQILAYDTIVNEKELILNKEIPVYLSQDKFPF